MFRTALAVTAAALTVAGPATAAFEIQHSMSDLQNADSVRSVHQGRERSAGSAVAAQQTPGNDQCLQFCIQTIMSEANE